MSNKLPSEVPREDTLSILVASDIHLGYAEKDPIRGEDSYNTFEEILSLAKEKDVDLIFLGGDLFHDSKPTPKCIHRCMSLMRKYCMGDRPVAVEFLSDQTENFKHCVNPVVNYEDPNMNISIPIFSIHGNHDDPSGYGRLSSLDLLSVSGLVNYFGKWTDLTHVEVSPLLMRKGATQLALYGLSYLKDERLARLFKDYNVKMFRPKEEQDEWFNLFMLHQNRVDRGPNNYIAEEVLPSFLDLIIWGHEHECRIVPEFNGLMKFYVSQPGSPVATSLCEGEAVSKHVAVLNIYKKQFKMIPIPLKTVRPFVFDTLVLDECTIDLSNEKLSDAIQDYLTEHLLNLLDRAASQITGDPRQPELPLIRLRVEYSDEKQMFNAVRFGLQFADRVANPTDMVLFRKHRTASVKGKAESKIDKESLENIMNADRHDTWEKSVERIVERYFNEEAPNQHLQILSIKGLAEAASRFVNKGDKDALYDLVKHQMDKTVNHVLGKCTTEEEIEPELENFRLERLARSEQESKDACQILDDPKRHNYSTKKDTKEVESFIADGSDSDDNISVITNGSRGRGRGQDATPARGRGRGRGSRGPRAPRGSTRGRGQKETVVQPSIREALNQSQPRTSRASSSKRNVIYIDDSD